MKYKNITISKISDHNGEERTPTHAIKVTIEGSKSLIVGKLWTKTGQYGKFLSGVMANEFKGEKGTFPGYCIVEDKYIQELEEKVRLFEASIPKETGTTYQDDGVTKTIPF